MKRFDTNLSASTEINITPSGEFRIYVEYGHRIRKQGTWHDQHEYGFFNLTTGNMESCPATSEWTRQDAVSADSSIHYPKYFTDRIYAFVRELWRNATLSFSRKPTLKELWTFWDVIHLDVRDRPGVSWGTANLPIHEMTCPECGKTVSAFVEKTREGRLRWIPVEVEGSWQNTL